MCLIATCESLRPAASHRSFLFVGQPRTNNRNSLQPHAQLYSRFSRRTTNEQEPGTAVCRERQPPQAGFGAWRRHRKRTETDCSQTRRRSTIAVYAVHTAIAERKEKPTGGSPCVSIEERWTFECHHRGRFGVIVVRLGVCVEELWSLEWKELTSGSASGRQSEEFSLQ